MDYLDHGPGVGADFPLQSCVALVIGDALEVTAGNAVADGAVGAFFPGRTTAFQVQNLGGPHPGQVGDDHGGGRSQMHRQRPHFAVVDAVGPRLSIDGRGDRRGQGGTVCEL